MRSFVPCRSTANHRGKASRAALAQEEKIQDGGLRSAKTRQENFVLQKFDFFLPCRQGYNGRTSEKLFSDRGSENYDPTPTPVHLTPSPPHPDQLVDIEKILVNKSLDLSSRNGRRRRHRRDANDAVTRRRLHRRDATDAVTRRTSFTFPGIGCRQLKPTPK